MKGSFKMKSRASSLGTSITSIAIASAMVLSMAGCQFNPTANFEGLENSSKTTMSSVIESKVPDKETTSGPAEVEMKKIKVFDMQTYAESLEGEDFGQFAQVVYDNLAGLNSMRELNMKVDGWQYLEYDYQGKSHNALTALGQKILVRQVEEGFEYGIFLGLKIIPIPAKRATDTPLETLDQAKAEAKKREFKLYSLETFEAIMHDCGYELNALKTDDNVQVVKDKFEEVTSFTDVTNFSFNGIPIGIKDCATIKAMELAPEQRKGWVPLECLTSKDGKTGIKTLDQVHTAVIESEGFGNMEIFSVPGFKVLADSENAIRFNIENMLMCTDDIDQSVVDFSKTNEHINKCFNKKKSEEDNQGYSEVCFDRGVSADYHKYYASGKGLAESKNCELVSTINVSPDGTIYINLEALIRAFDLKLERVSNDEINIVSNRRYTEVATGNKVATVKMLQDQTEVTEHFVYVDMMTAEAKGVEDLNIGTHYLDENKVESTSKPETKPKPKPETKPKPKPETKPTPKPETTKKDPYEKLGSFFDIPMYTQEQNEWAADAMMIWIATQPSGQEPSNAGVKAHAKMILEMIDLQIGDWNPKHNGWEYIDEEGGESIIIPGGSKMSGVGWD